MHLSKRKWAGSFVTRKKNYRVSPKQMQQQLSNRKNDNVKYTLTLTNKSNDPIVVTTEEQYPQHIMIEFVQDKTNLLDNFNFSNKISFIKIDVEGHETEVIKGSEATIKKNKPILLVEIEEKYTLKKVIDTLNYINSLGYNSFYFKDNTLNSTNTLNDLNSMNNFIFKPL